MDKLRIGVWVRITAGIPAFEYRAGRIVEIAEPYVLTDRMKEQALLEMPLYSVQIEDGRRFRFRGRDLQPLKSIRGAELSVETIRR